MIDEILSDLNKRMQQAIVHVQTELNKFVHKLVEDGRVAIRNVRRDGIQSLQNFEKEGHVSEDVIKDNELEVQKIVAYNPPLP